MERKLHDNLLYVRNDSRKKECFVRLFLPAFLQEIASCKGKTL